MVTRVGHGAGLSCGLSPLPSRVSNGGGAALPAATASGVLPLPRAGFSWKRKDMPAVTCTSPL